MIVGWWSRGGAEWTCRWIVLWGMFSTDGADKIRAVVSKMTFLSAMEAGGITHVLRIKVQLLEN